MGLEPFKFWTERSSPSYKHGPQAEPRARKVGGRDSTFQVAFSFFKAKEDSERAAAAAAAAPAQAAVSTIKAGAQIESVVPVGRRAEKHVGITPKQGGTGGVDEDDNTPLLNKYPLLWTEVLKRVPQADR